VRFWDSSALIPLLVQQPSSPACDEWFSDDNVTAVWTFTIVEITSALWRLVREGRLGEPDARQAEDRAGQVIAASYTLVDVPSAKALAQRLLRIHPLRAADALQLAAALVWSGGRPEGRFFLTLDDRLGQAAQREGFIVPAA
jgi:predicted nucleic acid-binding protein